MATRRKPDAAARSTALHQAASLARRGQPLEALEALRTAWSAAPDDTLVEPAHRLLESCETQPIALKTETATQAQWLELAKTRDRSVLPQLVKTPWPRLPKWAKQRMVLLLAFTPDLLVDVAIRQLVVKNYYESVAGDLVIRFGLRALFARKDPLAPVLVAHTVAHGTHRTPLGVAAFEALAARTLKPAEPLTGAELESVRSLSGPTNAEAVDLKPLELAVLRSPNDDGPRAVLADALTQLGNPRGEFITLQLTPASKTLKAREGQFLREHGRSWLGELEPFLEATVEAVPLAFGRGFVSNAILGVRAAESMFAKTEQWATVETIDLRWRHDDRELGHFEFHDNLRSLKKLLGVRSFAGKRVPPLEHLSVYVDGRCLIGAPLTAVTKLEILFDPNGARAKQDATVATLLKTFTTAPWTQTLTRIEIPGVPALLPQVRSLLDTYPRVEVLELGLDFNCEWLCRLSRSGELTIVPFGRAGKDALTEIEDLTRSMNLNQLASIQFVDQYKKLRPNSRGAVRQSLASILKRANVSIPVTIF